MSLKKKTKNHALEQENSICKDVTVPQTMFNVILIDVPKEFFNVTKEFQCLSVVGNNI